MSLTVLTPPSESDLTTLEVVKEELGIMDTGLDKMLSRWISEASATIGLVTNRTFGLEDLSETFRFDMQRTNLVYEVPHLRLSRYPVAELTSLIDMSTSLPIDPGSYDLDAEKGLIWRLSTMGWRSLWWTGYQDLIATYTAGYDLPDGAPLPLQEAVLLLIKHRLAARSRDPNLRQQNVPGVLEQTWWVPSGAESAIPPEVAMKIEPYREQVV